MDTAPPAAQHVNSLRLVTRQVRPRCLIGSLRLAALIARTASGFVSKVTISRGDSTCNAKNLVDLMLLDMDGAGREGEFHSRAVEIAAWGRDARAAVAALVQLFPPDMGQERCIFPECNERAVLIGPNEKGGFDYRCAAFEKHHEWEVAPPAKR